ncbi:MAG: decarboxylase [Gammaproteobacteria bacterium]|nr:decarboxylase [Gammaproteobacteria bacterium]
MTYYVYKIFPPKRLEYVDEFEAYREARTFTRNMRRALTSDDQCTVRMIFAPSKEQAEHLLRETREARPLGEDA